MSPTTFIALHLSFMIPLNLIIHYLIAFFVIFLLFENNYHLKHLTFFISFLDCPIFLESFDVLSLKSNSSYCIFKEVGVSLLQAIIHLIHLYLNY